MEAELIADWLPFNIWQMKNCARCARPDPCEIRRAYMENYETLGASALIFECKRKVEL